MRAKTIEYKHIMDDNAGGYYDQHVYNTQNSKYGRERYYSSKNMQLFSAIFIKIRQYSPNFA